MICSCLSSFEQDKEESNSRKAKHQSVNDYKSRFSPRQTLHVLKMHMKPPQHITNPLRSGRKHKVSLRATIKVWKMDDNLRHYVLDFHGLVYKGQVSSLKSPQQVKVHITFTVSLNEHASLSATLSPPLFRSS